MSVIGWLFGGVGGAVVATVIGVLFARSKKSVTQKQSVTGSHATSIQAGRDVHVGRTQQDREHDVQPIMHLVLNSGEGSPEGHFLNGTIKNVGRGIARNPKLFGPCVETLNLDHLIKPMEVLSIRVRYDHCSAFLNLLDDPTVRVEFENEFGTKFEQAGTLEQSRGPNSEVYQYSIKALGPVKRCE